MKVISGIYKGRKIIVYDIEGNMPTIDRVKESLFAMIQENIPQSVVLDLFAGSGNLGIESLSRQAKYVYFIDHNKKAIYTIKNNIKTIGIDNCTVIHDDFEKALKFLKDKKIKFDLIFLDPPYETDYIKISLAAIEKYNLLATNGLIICESNSKDKIITSKKFLELKEKKYGDKWVVILQQI